LSDKHLVLGGHGFVGQHIVKRLLEKGCDVRVLANSTQPACRAFQGDFSKNAEVVNGDYRDADIVRAALENVKCVYHLISTTTPASSIVDPTNDVQTNLLPTLQLLQLAVEQGVEQVVFSSSGGTVYGVLSQTPVLETHPTYPVSPHGIVKLAIEKYLHWFYHMYGLKYTILRIANPYGPGQNPKRGQGLISALLWRLVHNEPIEIWGDGQVVRDYIYVDDVARAVIMAAENKRPAQLFNVGSGSGVSIKELLEIIFDVTAHRTSVQYGDARAFDVPVSVLSIEKIQQEVGWQPRTSLEDGIHKTWE
jgi:UDP-glucose 4-epimerase